MLIGTDQVMCAYTKKETVAIDGIRYVLYSDNDKAIDAGVAGPVDDLEDVKIPDIVSYDGKDYIVDKIERDAFKNCVNMASVSLPNTINTIYDSAFEGCIGLNNIVLSKSLSYI